MSEKSNGEIKCTLAACVEAVDPNFQSEKLPLHITILPPVLIPEAKLYDLIYEYYNLISSWSSYLYDDDEQTIVSACPETELFGTAEKPIPVRRINLKTEQDKQDLLTLREWLRESTEEICGKESTKDWYLGELHVSENNGDLTVLDTDISIRSLMLFVKKQSKWVVHEEFIWND